MKLHVRSRSRRFGSAFVAALILGGCGFGDVEGEAVRMATEYAREDAEDAHTSIEGILEEEGYTPVDGLAEKMAAAVNNANGEVIGRSVEGSAVRVKAAFTEKATAGGGLLAATERVRLCVSYLAASSRVEITDVPCPSGLTPPADVTITPQPE